ncbi:BLUE COPPER PROTEIN [Salix viminalis]|uniref:BLUE COPPER PROTEIN n=1 Tax=Salix viminalis TaxID=40686 RepID=A0A9Q0SHK7_SALVM|nr:BLUE COPPER PROTEIN [Salix viminalis]
MVRTFISLAFRCHDAENWPWLLIILLVVQMVGGTQPQTCKLGQQQIIFLVGDNLIFQYGPSHDVIEVSKAGYDSCQVSSPLQSYSGGTTAITLSSPGKRYFTCATPGHCSGGMKLEIDTLATSTPPPASPLTPPPASPLTPPPASTLFPPASSSPPEVYNLSPSQSPEMTPTMSPSAPTTSPLASPTPSPLTTPSLKTPLSSSARKEGLQSSLTMGISLVIVMVLLAI